jgi:hypothetical protein
MWPSLKSANPSKKRFAPAEANIKQLPRDIKEIRQEASISNLLKKAP